MLHSILQEVVEKETKSGSLENATIVASLATGRGTAGKAAVEKRAKGPIEREKDEMTEARAAVRKRINQGPRTPPQTPKLTKTTWHGWPIAFPNLTLRMMTSIPFRAQMLPMQLKATHQPQMMNGGVLLDVPWSKASLYNHF
jgi:hypothetical protein